MAIWNLESSERSGMILWRTAAHEFRVVKYSQPTTMLTNVDYILIDKKFKEVFINLPEQVEINDVVFHDKVRKLTWDNYFEIKLLNSITKEEIRMLNVTGQKIWLFQREYVFVSTELKNELEKIAPGEFFFGFGLSGFGGSLK